MSEFQPIYPETINLDPYKKVKYSNGLVLGVDEFEQEQVYLLEKDQLHNRSLHGYGTVCGLNVTLVEEQSSGSWEVQVSPGIAVDKVGRSVRVTQTQCASLDVWLLRNSARINELLSEPLVLNLAEFPIYVVLCYDECETDYVPVPSGPCQSLDKTSVPSRVADNIKLKLQLELPEQIETESIQTLIDILSSIKISDDAGGLTITEIEELVRTFDMPASPLHMNSGVANDLIAAAFRVWATEVRPGLLPNGRNCIAGPPREQCILLAQLNTSIEDTESELGFRLQPGSTPFADQNNRPILIQSRIFQEFMQQRLATLQSEVLAQPDLNPTDWVNINSSQTITGAKTFSREIALSGSGQVKKVIHLPAYLAHNGRGANRGLFSKTLPSMHFMTAGRYAFTGEALFSLPIPDDIQFSSGVRFRLIWGFSGEPEPADINFAWLAAGKFYTVNESIPGASMKTVEVPVEAENARRNDILETNLFSLVDVAEMAPESLFGFLSVRIAESGITLPKVYLLQVEMHYIADRLGRRAGDEKF